MTVCFLAEAAAVAVHASSLKACFRRATQSASPACRFPFGGRACIVYIKLRYNVCAAVMFFPVNSCPRRDSVRYRDRYLNGMCQTFVFSRRALLSRCAQTQFCSIVPDGSSKCI